MRSLLLVCAALTVVACSHASGIDLYVIAAPDADPFFGPDAATQARITIEDDATPVQTVDVMANGAFDLQIAPADPNESSRLRIDALLNGAITAIGITPAVPWQGAVSHILSVLMQPPDSIVPAPANFRIGRANIALLADAYGFYVYAPTMAPGSLMDQPPESYNVISNTRDDPPISTAIPRWCDADCSIIPLLDGWLLTRGQTGVDCAPAMQPQSQWPDPHSVFYTVGTQNAGQSTLPSAPSLQPRCSVFGSTVIPFVDGAGEPAAYVVGGHDASGAPLARVDSVDNTLMWLPLTATALVFPRNGPVVIDINPAEAMSAGLWLLAGGQDPTTPNATLLESFGPSTPVPNHAFATSLDDRTDVAATCAHYDATGACTAILVLGGKTNGAGGAATAVNDAVIDGRCVAQAGACPVVAQTGAWLVHRRWGARAALAESGRVVITGGHDENGAVLDVESIDVSGLTDPTTPLAPAHVIGATACADPSLIGLTNGSVFVAGGTDSNGNGCVDIAFYR